MLIILIIAMGLLTLMGTIIAVYVSLKKKQKKSAVDDELRLAKEIIASGVDYYKRLDRMLQEIRILRHDYKYQIGVVEKLARIGNAKHIHDFLESTRNHFVQTEPVVYCENMIVSALLVNYTERFAGNNIPFKVQAVLPTEFYHAEKPEHLDNYEICMVLGNLLENSLEGTLTTPPDKRRVTLTMRLVNEQILIEVQNTFDGNLIFSKSQKGQPLLPLTRKGSEGGHGLKSIMAVCKRHGGQYLPQWTDNEYTVRILLNV